MEKYAIDDDTLTARKTRYIQAAFSGESRVDVTSVSVESFKPFRTRQDLQIRPITVLIGKNNSGKSALARAPLLIGHALSEEADAPLDLSVGGLDLAGSFSDLVYARKPHGHVTIGAEFATSMGGKFSLSAKVQYFHDVRTQIVTEFELRKKSGEYLKLNWVENQDSLQHEVREYNAEGVINGQRPVPFRGLLPQFRFNHEPDFEGRRFVRNARFAPRSMVHFGPFREAPQRLYRYPGKLPKHVGESTGSQAAFILGTDYHQSREIFEKVSEWYSKNLEEWSLDLEDKGEMFSLVIRRPKQAPINVVDAGQGISQILPLLVQQVYAGTRTRFPCITVVEQPELHLHPAAHAAVADLYINSVKTACPTRYIIETHSETFILRLRRRVAEGTLPPDKVIIYWASNSDGASSIKPIEINPDGSVTYWPEGVFSEDYDEVRKITSASKPGPKPDAD